MKKTLYLKLNQITEVTGKDVYLKDVAKAYCQDSHVQNRCMALKVKTIKEDRDKRYMEQILDVIQLIQEMDSNVDVINMGETDYIIDYQHKKPQRAVWQWTKTGLVCSVSFFGAAFAIMTFNNDVNVADVFGEIYLMTMGKESTSFTILEFSYSIGLAAGIIGFFNHFNKRKLNTDPTPLEVEMRLYEESICKTLIQNAERKEAGIDVS